MNQNQSFFDKNTLIAMLLMFGIWMAYNSYLNEKYPNRNTVESKKQQDPGNTSVDTETKTLSPVESSDQIVVQELEKKELMQEKLISYEDEYWKFDISNIGLGLRNIELKKYEDREENPIRFSQLKDLPLFSTSVANEEKLFFQIEKLSDTEYRGIAESNGSRIIKTIKILSEKYLVDVSMTIENTDNIKNVKNLLYDFVKEKSSTSFFNPSYERQEVFLQHGTEVEREIFHSEERNPFQKMFSKVAVASFNSQYFATAILDESDIFPSFSTSYKSDSQYLFGVLKYQIPKDQNKIDLKYKLFAGPKKLSLLQSIDPRMNEIVDFGTFSFLAEPMLNVLIFFYNLIKNYGFAIIILTILVRLVVLPFNIMSYKSMKKMKDAQPYFQQIREQFKEDPVKMNQEIMEYMKKEKLNPVGGCFPMLLQLPVFFALYQVLGQSIELYDAPFIFWIQDLSLKDPYYLLPILMGITMFLQQKLTPTSMDPTQAKIFMVMPILFSFFMISLPSGLTLYIFVSTLFGVIQQFILMRENPKEA